MASIEAFRGGNFKLSKQQELSDKVILNETLNECSCVDKNNVQIGAFGVNENVEYWYPQMGCK